MGSGFTFARNSACFSQKAAMASWPKVMAASMSSSEIIMGARLYHGDVVGSAGDGEL